MGRAGRILVVDDNERWRDLLSEVLEQQGFLVDTASTAVEALEHIAQAFYHLLILDIRMEDADDSNVEGMDLLAKLKEKKFIDDKDQDRVNELHIIMLSAYGTKDQMRKSFRDFNVEDFLTKEDFDDTEFSEQVQRLFERTFQINLQLAVHWQQVSGPEPVIMNKRFGGVRVSRDNSALVGRAVAELDDLLCRLFHHAESVLTQPLSAGRSDAGVLWAQPFLPAGGGRAVVVKFGDVREIETEYHNFAQYVQPFMGGGRNTTVLDRRHTLRLGGIIYSLLGAGGEQLDDFERFYRRADMAQIAALLDRLFFDTCSGWYASPGKLQLHDLTKEYEHTLGFTLPKLDAVLAERFSKSVQGKQHLTFRALESDRSFANPILKLGDKHLMRPTYLCTTHGDFNPHNVLIDGDGHAWLIDFMRTGPGHILRDVALLDAAMRTQLLAPEEATLAERLQMEELLCSTGQYSQLKELARRVPNDNPAIAKAYATSLHLRGIARRLTQQNASEDMSEYHIAVLYQSLNMIRFYGMPIAQREHALVSAALLAERLGL
jgi:CheY-like chemotaxis protein